MTRDELLGAMAKAAHSQRCDFHIGSVALMGHYGMLASINADVDAALPVAVEAVLARIEEVHRVHQCGRTSPRCAVIFTGDCINKGRCAGCGNSTEWPCPTIKLCDQIRDEWGRLS